MPHPLDSDARALPCELGLQSDQRDLSPVTLELPAKAWDATLDEDLTKQELLSDHNFTLNAVVV